ncbi:hypothetical protein GCM10010211_28940 [Streptomyces albospinus]|uniref:Uncharacterized protein n=1 Tax=Streptomyces albospinus TaxID=285515 RepID=A0ABQ2UZT1_9ACTN|nr:hypothetical protein GCM10010211_28940 [Streptomyces albospinus]
MRFTVTGSGTVVCNDNTTSGLHFTVNTDLGKGARPHSHLHQRPSEG